MQTRHAAHIAVLSLAALLAACGGTAVVAPPVSEAPATPVPTGKPSEVPVPSADPEPTPVVVPSDEPVEPAPADPAPEPEPEPAEPSPVTPRPTRPAPVAWTDAERQLVGELRVDAAINCSPRRSGLPDGASTGVECRVGSSLVERVGIYRFADDEAMLKVYLERLAEHGVEPRSGACGLGEPGDSAWTPGDEPGYPLVTARDGCFHDENGQANLRIMCGGTYIGVLGGNDDIAALSDWAAIYDENFPGDTPSPAGLCYGPADAWY